MSDLVRELRENVRLNQHKRFRGRLREWLFALVVVLMFLWWLHIVGTGDWF
jgi:hypothetical protein